jgi:hypothetical protein
MTDFLKLVTAVLAIYFGILGIRGSNNVDAEGRYTSSGKRTLGIFLVLSLLGVLAMLRESLDKSRETDTADRRYVEATARDSANLFRSELLLQRTEVFFRNLHRLDSLTQLQLATRTELLDQQQAVLASQSALLRNTVRARFPYSDSMARVAYRDSIPGIPGMVALAISPTYEPANRLLDSIWRTAVAYIPTLIRDSAKSALRREFVVNFEGQLRITYTINADTTLPWEQRIRPKEFFLETIDFRTHPSPLTRMFLTGADLEFFCCGHPKLPSEIPMLSAMVGGINMVAIRGTWDNSTIQLEMSVAGIGRSPNLSVTDLVGARVLLRMSNSVLLAYSRASIFLPVAQHRNLVLSADRWRRVEDDPKCNCLSTNVLASDLELYPGELTGAPQRPMIGPLAPLRQGP